MKIQDAYQILKTEIRDHKEVGLALLAAGIVASVGAITDSETAVNTGMNLAYIAGLYRIAPETFI